MARKRLGECLIEAGVISKETLDAALEVAKRTPKLRLGRVLINMGVADDLSIARALATQLRLPLVDLKNRKIPVEVTESLPKNLILRLRALPVEVTDDRITVALADPLEQYALEEIRFATKKKVSIAVSPEGDLIHAIETSVPHMARVKFEEANAAVQEVGVEFVDSGPPKDAIEDVQNLAALSSRPPLIRLVNSIFADAIEIGASDVHIEPGKDSVTVRFRVDGILRVMMTLDVKIHSAIVSRIKILSDIDISERRKPQDGKAQVRFGDRVFDLRVSTIPTTYGESVTVRLLDPNRAAMFLEKLGFSPREFDLFTEALNRPQGIILVTGPTGSGKSSTLYAGLNILNEPEVKIITVEDPVEYHVDGINQVQIQPKAGITFASGLRAILRQDPDIVMVGEIRDNETATIAIQAAQTGHLVLSTLHTNDAPSAVVRLIDIGVEYFLISASVICIIAQRLVRRICSECKVVDNIDPVTLKKIKDFLDPQRPHVFYKGKGCSNCHGTGFSGRVGLYEIFPFTDKITEFITAQTSAKQLRMVGFEEGYRPIFFDGLEKSLAGVTTIEEVLRIADIPYYAKSAQSGEPSHPAWLETAIPNLKPEKKR